ncbi:MAG: GNAT family N-acetyltransferase [Pseudomonadota bacterium]
MSITDAITSSNMVSDKVVSSDRPHAAIPAGYDDLAQNALTGNVFFNRPLLEAAFNHLAPPSVALATARNSTGALIAAAPVQRERWGYGPISAFQPLSVWHHPYSMLGMPLIDKDKPLEAACALMDALTALPSGPPILLMNRIDANSSFLNVLEEAISATGRTLRVLNRYQRAALDLPETAGLTQRDLLGSNSMRTIKTSHRKLSEHGTVRYKQAATRSEIDDQLGMFFALEASGWKKSAGTALLTIGHTPFVRDVVLELAEADKARLYSVCLDGKPVASTLAICQTDVCKDDVGKKPGNTRTWMPWKIGVDDTYRAAGPGTLNLAAMTKDLLTETQETGTGLYLDSLADSDSVIANRLWRQKKELVDLVIDLKPGGSTAFKPIFLAEIARQSARKAAKRARATLSSQKHPGR